MRATTSNNHSQHRDSYRHHTKPEEHISMVATALFAVLDERT
jgi:hypothetical protein